jgi:uncharacterized protein (TIGR03000 family)
MARRFALSALAVATVLLFPLPSFAQFLDRWQEWGNGYGYGRSGFDIGKPGSAFSPPNWPSYYPDRVFGYHGHSPAIIINVYPPPVLAPVLPTANPGAVIHVHVPADAQVSFEGTPTRQTGSDRLFLSPPLDPAQTYTYDISARWLQDGKERREERTVSVRAGHTVNVDFGAR